MFAVVRCPGRKACEVVGVEVGQGQRPHTHTYTLCCGEGRSVQIIRIACRHIALSMRHTLFSALYSHEQQAHEVGPPVPPFYR